MPEIYKKKMPVTHVATKVEIDHDALYRVVDATGKVWSPGLPHTAAKKFASQLSASHKTRTAKLEKID